MSREHTYNQPSKAEVRRRVLTKAVNALTQHRSGSAVLDVEHVHEVMQYGLNCLRNASVSVDAEREFEDWVAFHCQIVGARKPSELKVLLLCGPEPMNDLRVLIESGVNPHNIWAVESDAGEFRRANKQICEFGVPAKVYNGGLAEFFDLNSQVFDIIYMDGCSALGHGSPSSLSSVLHLFQRQRLSSLGCLITTFSEISQRAEGSFVDVLSAYYRYRYNDMPDIAFELGVDPADAEHDDSFLKNVIRENFGCFYSDFITSFVVDLARSLVPNCRAFAYSGSAKSHLADLSRVKGVIDAAARSPNVRSIEKFLEDAGDFVLNPSSYPILSFLRRLNEVKEKCPKFANPIFNFRLSACSIMDGAEYSSVLSACVEGHWHALGEQLLRAIAIGWFDRELRISCDVPMPNLMVNSFLGTYGYPSFVNPPMCDRYEYRAKKTVMYTDLLLFDGCRSYFDWFPTIQTASQRFESHGFQVLARSLMDGIGWADWRGSAHPFRGAAMAGWGATSKSEPRTFADREVIG